jgi:hypothetical protein
MNLLTMAKEFAGLDFHSVRLENRFIRTMKILGKQPDKSTTPPQADGVCCSRKVFDSGSKPLVPPQGSPAQAGSWVWTLRNESRIELLRN